MTDHHTTTTPLSPRVLTTRLTALQTSPNPDPPTKPQGQRPSTSSLPPFSKSSITSSTTSHLPASPHPSITHPSIDLSPADLSKPRVHPRSRRDTGSSTGSGRSSKSEGSATGKDKEFQYYGRHANQWLFNDFSVKEAVAKGMRRVFGREGEKGDWYERRGR